MFIELHIGEPLLYTHQGVMTSFGEEVETYSILDAARSPSSLGSVTLGNECFD